MSFTFSPQINSNKLFLINRHDLDRRLDPFFYKPEFQKLVCKIKNVAHDKFGNIVNFSKEIWDQKSFFNNIFPYIEIGEIDTADGTIKQINEIEIQHAPSRAKMIARSGDILVSTTRPGRGAIAKIFPSEKIYVASTGFAVIRGLKRHDIDKNFLFHVTRASCSLSQMEQRSSGGNYPAISQEELENILIPIPSKEIQLKIVSKIEAAYLVKKEKEVEADNLLESIDSYLLSELGINIPIESKDTIQQRIFKRQFLEICGKRFDPKAFSSRYKNLRKAIEASAFKVSRIEKFITHSQAGDWGIEVETENLDGSFTKCVVLRATEFDNRFNLNIENSRLKRRLISNEKLKQLDIRSGDLLLEKSGGSPDQPVGRIAILEEKFFDTDKICYSNFIHKFRVNTQVCLPDYLFCFLKTIHNIGLTESMQSQTNGIRNLILKEYFYQPIPLPPLIKQREIAEHIYAVRNQAKQLQIDAKENLEKARAEMEEIIFDGGA